MKLSNLAQVRPAHDVVRPARATFRLEMTALLSAIETSCIVFDIPLTWLQFILGTRSPYHNSRETHCCFGIIPLFMTNYRNMSANNVSILRKHCLIYT